MTDSLKTVRTRKAPVTATKQTVKAAKGQKKNSAGGYVFKIEDLERAKRFLILGSESNFYQTGQEMSAQNAKTLIKLASSTESSKALVDLIVEVSTEGRAPKANPAIFALAIAASHGDTESKSYALAQLPAVLRIGTHLFLFANYIEQFRGWGRGLKRAVANWYTEKDVDKVAYQAVKYQSREGFSHRDLFRLSHPESVSADFRGLGEWILRGDSSEVPRIVEGFVKAHAAETKDVPALVREYGLSWEMLPTEALNEPKVWEALLDGNVPLGALIRQLPRLTRLGLLAPMSDTLETVVSRITNQDELVRARIHPLNVLISLKTYASGRSERGSSTWTPVSQVVDALDKAFYLAFKAVEPAGKRTMIGLDVSGSMGWGNIAGLPMTPREATAALALVTVATEPKTLVTAFSHKLVDIDISPRQRLDDVVRKVSNMSFGGTDAALPIQKALRERIEVDTFLILTDNDTWSGDQHVFQALKQYRDTMGIPAKLIVVGTTSSKFSIADPNDSNSLDVAGFDSATPAMIANFSRGF
jgi:60 kDa SS-A/Ro ribonucleoprotein